MVESGIKRISISLDGASREKHDRFRGVEGAFDSALRGIEMAKKAGLEFQINTTITRTNLAEIPRIQQLAVELGAVAHHIFLLVPTGRGKYIIDQEITAEEYEQTLNWFYDQRDKTPLQLKATCAPHYYRILRQRARSEGKTVTPKTHGLDAMTRGCLGGIGFCFISHRGIVQPCGFLNVDGRRRHPDILRRYLESFRDVSVPAPLRRPERQVRSLRVQEILWRLQSAGFRGHRGYSGPGALVQLPAGAVLTDLANPRVAAPGILFPTGCRREAGDLFPISQREGL